MEILQGKDVKHINTSSNVVVVTLWSDKDKIIEKLGSEREKVKLIGQLYSKFGINYLLQTLLYCNEVNTLIIYGHDLSGSGEELIKLFNGRTPSYIQVKEELINLLRKEIRVIDLRNRSIEELKRVINESYSPIKAERKRMKVTIGTIDVPFVKSELSGYKIHSTSIFEAWIKLLNYILIYGAIKHTEYGNRQKEYLNTVVVIDKNFEIDKRFETFFAKEEIEKYMKDILSKEKPKDVNYTYGNRLRAYFGVDQLKYIIEKLGKAPFSRRAVAVTLNPTVDENNNDMPCLNEISCIISENKLFLTAFFRSHDIFKAWPINFYGLVAIRDYILKEINKRYKTNYQKGAITVISSSAHIYEEDWKRAKEVVDKYLPTMCKKLELDPKGNFVIKVNEGRIIVNYHDAEGNLVRAFEREIKSEKDIDDLRKEIIGNLSLTPQHASYLGKELYKAYTCLKLKLPYKQDKEILKIN